MTPSTNCANLIKGYESCRLHAYLPTPHDVPTIGWGATGPDIHMGTVWTQKQADDTFTVMLAMFASHVTADIGKAPTLQREFDAMTSLAYNIGAAAFAGSSVLKYHKAGVKNLAADAFLLWDRQNGNVVSGLLRRRRAERAMYLGIANA